MIQDNNLYKYMSRFFGSLPSNYILAADEQIELVWMPRGKNQPTYTECFADLEQASQKAVSLGPAYDVFLQVVVEPDTTLWETDSTQLLASWYARDRRPDDHPAPDNVNIIHTQLKPLPYAEPSLVYLQFYPDGDYTCVASSYLYRSRCPIRAEKERRRKPAQTEEGGSDKGQNRA